MVNHPQKHSQELGSRRQSASVPDADHERIDLRRLQLPA
jgi:hypothetical protein